MWRKAQGTYYPILWIISGKRQILAKYKGVLNNQNCSGLKRLPGEEVSSVPLLVCREGGAWSEFQTGFWTLNPSRREITLGESPTWSR